ncbi:MAG: hypothetical protein AABM67_06755 [Acidobacteriota bacterium]
MNSVAPVPGRVGPRYAGISGCSGNACAAPFPANGYITSVDIYLDADSLTIANDTRFDFSSAINQPDGNHRRDFVFNAGFYNDTDLTGTGPRFVISASNNAGRSGAFPKNPGRDPFTIADAGWYTFQHTFTDNGSGVLTVTLTIKDAAGTALHSWTLSDPTDFINTVVGSNRYGAFALQEFSILAIDNSSRFDIQSQPADKEQCKNDGWKLVVNGQNAPFKNQGQCVKFVNTGKIRVLLKTIDVAATVVSGRSHVIKKGSALSAGPFSYSSLFRSTHTLHV